MNQLRVICAALIAQASLVGVTAPVHAEVGVTDSEIRIATVLDLEGRSSGLGQAMLTGMRAAFSGQQLRGRNFELMARNDSYQPQRTQDAVNELLALDPFLFIGNVGTPTARVTLPKLAENGVPAVGFFSGAGLLRPGQGQILNFRASYQQETAAVIDAALSRGIGPTEVCAYVENNSFGLAGVAGVHRALRNRAGAAAAVEALEKVQKSDRAPKERNGIGPVGFYERNTLTARDGFQSLKKWEQANNTRCRLVVTAGAYDPIAKFVAYSRYKGEKWLVSTVSFTGAESLATALRRGGVGERVLMTQVVPALDTKSPVIQEARKALGGQFGYVSLEGYLVAKMTMRILDELKTQPITRKNFMAAAEGRTFDLGGLIIDFSNDNQGSDLVEITRVGSTGWESVSDNDWTDWLQ